MTCPTLSADARGGGASPSRAKSRAQSSSTTKAPCRSAMSSTRRRRSGGRTVPAGLLNVGWQKNRRAPLRLNASSSRSGITPSASVGTGTGSNPAAQSAAMAP